jgi:hypothetical protein
MSPKSRLDQLQRKVSQKSQSGGTRDFAAEESKRWEMTERILELTRDDLRVTLAGALVERDERGFSTKRSSRLHSWICDLGFDRTRLPEDLSPETMRKLLLIYLEDTPPESVGDVCDRCGLYRPYRGASLQNAVWVDASNYFDSCPHCGCRESTPSYAVGVWSQRAGPVEGGKRDDAQTKPSPSSQTEEASRSFFDGETEAVPLLLIRVSRFRPPSPTS